MKINVTKYRKLINSIGGTITNGRGKALKLVNFTLVKTNWEIGKHCLPNLFA